MELEGDQRIERCLRLLKRLSESNGGTLSHHIVTDVMDKTGCEPTFDVLEFIYDQLVARGVRIDTGVSTEPPNLQGLTCDTSMSGAPSMLEGNGGTFEASTYGVKSIVKRFSHSWQSLQRGRKPKEADYLTESDTLFLEEVIDEFLFCAESNQVSWSLFMRLAAKYRLTVTDALEVVEYLKSLGFEFGEIELYLEGLCSAANVWKNNYGTYDGEPMKPTARSGSYDRFLVKLLEKCRRQIPILVRRLG